MIDMNTGFKVYFGLKHNIKAMCAINNNNNNSHCQIHLQPSILLTAFSTLELQALSQGFV